jgi:hypothetical protein
MEQQTNPVLAWLFAAGVLAAVFMLLRRLVLWYWRVGEAVQLLKQIDEKLGALVLYQTGQAPPAAKPALDNPGI